MSDVGTLNRGDAITEIIDINEQANAGPCPNCNGEVRQQVEKSPGRKKLESWLNKNMKIEMTDGRTLLGIFLCTDRDRNVILGSCSEYLKPDDDGAEEEPRVLGLAMVPGHHIVSIHIDDSTAVTSDIL